MVYDITTGSPVSFFKAGDDVVNSIRAFSLGDDKVPLLANTIGSRKFYVEEKTKPQKKDKMEVEGDATSETDSENEDDDSLFYEKGTVFKSTLSKQLQIWNLSPN